MIPKLSSWQGKGVILMAKGNQTKVNTNTERSTSLSRALNVMITGFTKDFSAKTDINITRYQDDRQFDSENLGLINLNTKLETIYTQLYDRIYRRLLMIPPVKNILRPGGKTLANIEEMISIKKTEEWIPKQEIYLDKLRFIE
jgi:hypothetical protein